jgi:ABC-type antimicrobial peptide transport system permease subunit
MLIIGTIVIASQMRYAQTADLGFDRNAIVVIPIPMNDKVKMNTLRTRITEVAGVEKISLCYQPPAANSNNTTGVKYNNSDKEENWGINVKDADDKYLSTFGIELLAGRNLYPSDTTREFLVNEAFVKKYPTLKAQDVVGKSMTINGDQTAQIVGVVKDFHNYSFRENIYPIVIKCNMENYRNCAIKINMKSARNLLPAVEKIWNETYPEYLYNYEFLDERIGKFYELDTIMLRLIEGFALIAILIGCLGLYGLVSFMALRKTKEIGVRKVLGAGVGNILWMFGKEFSQLLIIAFVIAAPIAWWVMKKYLQDFKFQIPIGAGIFLIAIFVTFIIAALTVGYRSMQSALANPVKSIRTE